MGSGTNIAHQTTVQLRLVLRAGSALLLTSLPAWSAPSGAASDDSPVAVPAQSAQAEATTSGPTDAAVPVNPPVVPSDPYAPWREHPLAFEAHLGIATPIGGMGAMVRYSLVPPFALGCGAGTNLVGLEVACNARLTWIGENQKATFFAVGVSGGPHLQTDTTQFGAFALVLAPLTQTREDSPPAPLRYKRAFWVNFEIGREKRKLSGLVAGIYLGGAFLLNPGDGYASTSDGYYGTVKPTHLMAYAGFDLGQAL
jgi:hypothetical protein